MSLIALLLACSPDPGPASDTAGTTAEVETPMPEVWGVPPAEDFDPDPHVVEVHMEATRSTIEWTEDGEAEVWTYNGQIPGPLISARVGDTVRVVFDNSLNEETTIHWHGLRIDNLMDGVPAVQDPIQPGEQFTYEFVVPESGSFWYHPHMRSYEQIERGLQGPIVIREAEETQVDKDRYFVIDDASLRNNGDFSSFHMSHMDSMMGRYGNILLVNGQSELLEDAVRPGGNERWRLVNTANARTMYATVTGASWRVIAIDGTILAEPYETERVRLPIGRRFDLEVIPDADASEAALVIQLPDDSDGWVDYPMFSGSPEGEPGASTWLDWPATELPAIEPEEQDLSLIFDAESGDDGLFEWSINGDTYADSEPLVVDQGKPSLITLKDRSGLDHPFHLHGQFFQVVERTGDSEIEPGFQDTVLVEGNEKVVIYTTFDNPGRWLAHCHILEHAEQGMIREIDVE